MLPYNKNLDVQLKDVSIDLLQPRVGYCKFWKQMAQFVG